WRRTTRSSDRPGWSTSTATTSWSSAAPACPRSSPTSWPATPTYASPTAPTLGSSHADHGWHLVDHATGTTYRSPRDDGEPSDYAYLGRLPRIDGRGTFLYLARIPAPGNAGAAHYLEGHLEELYGEVRSGCFSTI